MKFRLIYLVLIISQYQRKKKENNKLHLYINFFVYKINNKQFPLIIILKKISHQLMIKPLFIALNLHCIFFLVYYLISLNHSGIIAINAITILLFEKLHRNNLSYLYN